MVKTKRILMMGLIFLFTLLFSALSVSAIERVNVSIEELVTRNVTFAEHFNLEENINSNSIVGFVNISNPNTDTVYDIYVDFANTQLVLGNFTHIGGRNGSQFSNTTSTVTLHIPELRAQDSSLFNYSVSGSVEVLNMTSDYSQNTFSRKVLAGENFTIQQFAKNELDSGNAITNINITMETQGIIWNSTFTDNFTFATSTATAGDIGNVSNQTNRTWFWRPHGGSLGFNESANITFVIRAPDKVPSTTTYMMLMETLSYEATDTASNITLTNVSAKLKVGFNVTKRIAQPSNNLNDHNVTWEASGQVGVPYAVSYQLSQVDIWVTPGLDPNVYANDTVTGAQLRTNYTPDSEINETTPWQSTNWYFNYTDGTAGYPPPIVWMKPEYSLLFKRNQVTNFSFLRNATDLYMKYVYVISGYWLEVEKNVTSIAEDTYDIYIEVRNIGNAPTPQNLTVTVYDLIPSNFVNGTITPVPSATQAVTGSYNGTSLQWDIAQKQPINASLYERNDPQGRDMWNATYNVTGSGDYRVSDLYIVGLDPRQVDGAFSSPLITIIVGLQTYSKEILYLGVVMFLVVLNITNLVVSNKINRKIDHKLPMDHHKYHQLKKEIEHLKRQIK